MSIERIGAPGNGFTPLREESPRNSFLVNDDAEQALLGALLISNRAYDRIASVLDPQDFANAVHGRIYAAIGKMIEQGQVANPITLKALFDRDNSLVEIGGWQYLVRLADSAVTIANVPDYALTIADLYRRRAMIDLCQQTIEDAAVVELDKPAVKLIDDHEQRLYELSEKRLRGHGAASIGDAAQRALAQAEAAYKRGGALPGVATGLADLDRILGGLLPGDLEILAGRPAMGKTALATDIALYAAEHGAPVVMFELEQTGEQLAQRKLASRSGVSTGRQRQGDIQPLEWDRLIDAAAQFASVPLYIDDTPALSVGEIRQRARRMKRRQGIKLVVVDHLQLVRAAGKFERRQLEIGMITRGLKQVAKELDLPVLLLSQLSRGVDQREDKRPKLSDLREAGDIEQDADRVMFLYREEYYLDAEEPKQRADEVDSKFADRQDVWHRRLDQCRAVAEIIIAKDRHGPSQTLRVHWDAVRMRFENLARGL